MDQIALNIDCMEYMKSLPDKAFDLAIVDPPYGISIDRQALGAGTGVAQNQTSLKFKNSRLNGGDKLKHCILNTSDVGWDRNPPSPEYFNELFRVSRNQIIWGGNYFDLPPTRGIVCWDKMQAFLNFSQWEMAWTSFDTTAKLFRYSNSGFTCPDKSKKIHPTQKPIALYEWLLTNYAKKGDKILDTHLGSGSSRIAAFNLGFEFVGCEIDKTYFDLQEKRFEEHTAQMRWIL